MVGGWGYVKAPRVITRRTPGAVLFCHAQDLLHSLLTSCLGLDMCHTSPPSNLSVILVSVLLVALLVAHNAPADFLLDLLLCREVR